MITRFKYVLVNFGLILASLLLCIAVAELFARIYLPAPRPEKWPLCKVRPDSILGWQMLPDNFHYTYTFPVHTNSYGLRDKEIRPKEEKEFRILVLGDSHVYGQGISNERLFTTLLEARLNSSETETNVNVINAGVRAYSINQEVAFLEHIGVTFEPDLVVLCFYLNDFEIVDIQKRYEAKKNLKNAQYYVFDFNDIDSNEKLRDWRLRQFLRQSRLGMYLYDRVNAWSARDDYRARVLNGVPDEEIKARIVQVDGYIQKFKQIIATNQIRGLIVVIPFANQINMDFSNELYQSTIASLAAEHGLEYLDLLPAFKQDYDKTGELPIIPFDGHYNERAHEIIAERLYAYIMKNRSNNEHSRHFSILP